MLLKDNTLKIVKEVKEKSMKKQTGIIICIVLAFIVLGGIGIGIYISGKPADDTYSASWESDGNKVYFNELDHGNVAEAAKLTLSDGEKKEVTLEEVNQYYGCDMSDCYIPENLVENNLKEKFDFYYDGDKVTSDRVVLWYSIEGGTGPDYPYMEIEFQKGKIPLSDMIYVDSDIKESIINGKKVTFIAEFQEGSTNYTAEFLNNEIGYRVIGIAISQKEFMKVIFSLLD